MSATALSCTVSVRSTASEAADFVFTNSDTAFNDSVNASAAVIPDADADAVKAVRTAPTCWLETSIFLANSFSASVEVAPTEKGLNVKRSTSPEIPRAA